MGFDFVSDDASITAISRDMAKKKRTHRAAKLKQCKLDARREQWLSQVKNKDSVVAGRGLVAPSPPPHPSLSKKLDHGPKEEDKEELRVSAERDGSNSHESEEGSPTHGSSLNGCTGNSISSGSSFRSSSRSISDDEVEGDDPKEREEEEMDDWEALADALSADDCSQSDPNPVATTPNSTAASEHTTKKDQPEGLEIPDAKQAVHRAWRPDDASRPQTLPNLSKQRSFPASIERHTAGWGHNGILSMPSSCPICYEDLDPTDSSFLPCNCGFRLCLFCHKRIIEADGRCPGCRKHYAPMTGGGICVGGGIQPLAIRFSRCFSMSSRT
ncbi:hypothetical protein Cni_G01326 [Canna indica]|uniref:RING-type domain-containing protein n=1 Tax=Canna indica TaxID=4628 RepID=A0AAQ3Q0V7_9LILI|nr:hypothetical protein Cni_G01326 [Canna indica]